MDSPAISRDLPWPEAKHGVGFSSSALATLLGAQTVA